ncbi:MAG: hypothetical protein ACF8R7_14075 [Phycisphaerales bacterium JB039]
MDDEFALMQRVHRSLVKSRPSMDEGMCAVVQEIEAELGREPWSGLRDVDWTGDDDMWLEWFNFLVRRHPMPPDTVTLWFETPDVLLNPAVTSVSAYNIFDPSDDLFGLDAPRTWPIDEEGWTLEAGLCAMPEFDAALARMGWIARRRNPLKKLESLEPGLFALVHAYTLLLVVNNLPRSDVDLGDGLNITMGFVDGDIDVIGRLTPAGWTRA